MFGYTVLGPIAFRLLWGFIGTHYARFASFLFTPAAVGRYLGGLVRGNPQPQPRPQPCRQLRDLRHAAGRRAHRRERLLHAQRIGGDASEELHEVLANGWLALVIVHVRGVVASSVLHRENLGARDAQRLQAHRRAAGRGRDGRPGASASASPWRWPCSASGRRCCSAAAPPRRAPTRPAAIGQNTGTSTTTA
ncbi:MAG: hypothetical protein U1F06_08635 [Steroidobacteraceae bacterium]